MSDDINIFDIGFRGMFENPFTEILAFLLKPERNCKAKEDFAKLFFDFLEKKLPNYKRMAESLKKTRYIVTQAHTIFSNTKKDRKIIDMIVYNKDYVITFENKITAKVNNPFEIYEQFIQKHFRGRKNIYILFSLNKESDQKWENILIGDIFESLEKRFSNKNDKLSIFIHDFLSHYIQQNRDPYDLPEDKRNEIKASIVKKLGNITIDEKSYEVGIFFFNIRHINIRNSQISLIYRKIEDQYSIQIYYHIDDINDVGDGSTVIGKVGTKYVLFSESHYIPFMMLEEYWSSDLEEILTEFKTQFDKMNDIIKNNAPAASGGPGPGK